tara:strand:+ start:2875 stop:5481 length:2607 start_codon:yes stop_codon:yes gene_type:complete
MAETLISPGVLARENDQSQITSQPIQAGAAIVGPTVLGRVGIPKLVTTYSEYLANYGSTFTSGSDTFTYFTSISAYNYFNNGGTSLLVTRVASGSWSPATSTAIPAIEDESGVLVAGGNVFPQLTSGGVGGTAATYPAVATTSPTGTGATLDVTTGVGAGKILAATVLAGATAGGTGGTSVGTFTGITPTTTTGTGTGLTADVLITTGDTFQASKALTISPTQTANAVGTTAALATTGVGTGATVTVTSDGVNITGATIVNVGTSGYASGDTLTVTKVLMDADGSIGTVAADLVITIAQGDLESTVTSVTAVNPGAGYANGNTITFASSDIGSSVADLVVTIATADLSVEPESATVNAQGTGYIVGDTLTVALAAIGSPSADLVFTLVDANIIDQNVFTLETISEGALMNSIGPENANGALASGSARNIRWEIQAPNTGSGVFSLIVRQGNDNSKTKSILEVFPNVSLDPKQSNYISRIVGDMTEQVRDAATAEPYLQSTGSYRNASRYVRVKSVSLKTPDYFDNSGIAKPEFTGSIPAAGSGSFSGADGNNLGSGVQAGYYDQISDSNTQGLTSTEADTSAAVLGSYPTAFNLLANQDEFNYNILTAPGLYKAGASWSSALTLALSTVQNRGDAILLMDLVDYGSNISQVTTQASSVDNSYAASYWPWVQINDPDSAQLVWCPASALIPGVFAYNDKSAEAWFAPAGINRGGLSTVVQAERKLTQTNRDDLYTGKVNPIATFPGRGVVVFGQKTLQSQASALDRINVRRLLIELKSYISQIADNLVFEQNTAATRNSFLAQVNPYLESVQQRQGLYAFKVVMDASNNGPDVVDRNQMVGAIYLQPTKTAEFIYLDFNILPTGAVFPS